MNNFNDRIYLILTLKKNEFLNYYLETVGVLLVLCIYNFIGHYTNMPIAIEYWSLLLAFGIITILFIYIRYNSLAINWRLLNKVKKELEAKSKTESEEPSDTSIDKEEPAPPIEEVPSNEEIAMIESVEDLFDFKDSLQSLYNTGTPKQLAEAGSKVAEKKVRHMNLY